ncbi:MAG: polyprenyl synthetase family protein [Arenimonas sp.]
MNNVNPLSLYLPEIRARLSAIAHTSEWPDFERQVERHLTNTKLPTHLVLPLACAAAVGGDPRSALSTATSCGFLLLAMRWFDDLQDRDRSENLSSEIGTGRAINMSAAALNTAWKTLADDEMLPPAALKAFGKYTTALARGQDLDLQENIVQTMDDYWRLMREKTGASLALACEVGMLAARPDNPELADVCARFGMHMGILMQILDDLDGAFRPVGIGDLHAGKATLPVLYGLATDHEARNELADIVHSGSLSKHAERAKVILDSIDTREFLVWSAFEEHRQAISCLQELPPVKNAGEKNGRDALLVYANLLMNGWENLLEKSDPDRVTTEPDPKSNVINSIKIQEQNKAEKPVMLGELHQTH